MSSGCLLNKNFYIQKDVLLLAKELLGKVLCCGSKKAVILETESYRAFTDKASHAYKGRRTKRNEAMYAEGGVAYVYLCYGMHCLFNVVTNEKDIPDAILIRKVQIDIPEGYKEIINGPALLTKALDITLKHNKWPLDSKELWIEDRNIKPKKIEAHPRIGIAYAEEDALLPWRFTASL